MDPERWRRVEDLYHSALSREPPARRAFLAEECGSDEELLREVDGLLAHDDSNAGFLESPALERVAKALAARPKFDFVMDTPTGLGFGDTPGGGLTPEPLAPGQVVRNFRIVRKIGAGGMGHVYLAEDKKLGRSVALKVLSAAAAPDPQARNRFLREARAASALNHPNIVTVHAVDEADGLDFIVMEYVEGETLRDRLGRGPLPLADVVALGGQVADAVAAGHAAGIVHRDLKPANILLTPTGRAKVVDFGLAFRVPTHADEGNGHGRLTGTGLVIGTVPYMSPEQTRGEAVDARSDVFSLGSVLYEAATGQRSFDGPSALSVMHEIATTDPPPPSTVRPGLPREFDRVIGRALAKDPGRRFGSAAELAAALREAGQSAEERRRVLAARRRRKWFIAAVLAAVAVVTGMAGYSYWRQSQEKWAKEALTGVEELARADRYFEAFELAAAVEKYLPGDPTLARLMPLITDDLTVVSDPPGAAVAVKRFAQDEAGRSPAWETVGTTPIEHRRIARGEYLLSVDKDGYVPFQRTISSMLRRMESVLPKRGELLDFRLVESPSGAPTLRVDATAPIRIEVKLRERAGVPERMVFVPGGKYELVGWGRPITATAQLDDYFIDRYEVSNREYKEFIAAGGYRRKELWKHPFVKNGKTLSWDEAVRHLTDRTGLPGPRGWTNQEFPPGRGDDPVAGVTWYEAAAYAEFRGKQLPTLFQWEKAARDGEHTKYWMAFMPWGIGGPRDTVTDRANLMGRAASAVDSYEFGISPYGCYHMAGNVAEWCRNARPLGFTTTGGSWKDPIYAFSRFGQYPGYYSDATLGFRCVRLAGQAAGDQGAMAIADDKAVPEFHPVGEKEYKEILTHYQYDRTPLDARVEEVVETADWRREKISFTGAGGERALAHLYLPQHARRPLQVIDYISSGCTWSGTLTPPQEMDVTCAPFVKAGRAVFQVVYFGFKERPEPPGYQWPNPPEVRYRDMVVRESTDHRRGLDYLETRKDIDMSKLACWGLSLAEEKLTLMAVEPRYCSILFMAAGLDEKDQRTIREASPVNLLPYVRVPKLLLNGRYDEDFPEKTAAEPLFKLLAEPKRKVYFEAGHVPQLELWVPVVQSWFDETLGPVAGP